MTQRENLNRVIFRTGEPEWVPVSSDCFDSIYIDGILAERPTMGEDGYDWFGCKWLYNPATNGRIEDPYEPRILQDIESWETQVQFPDLDKIDWEKEAARATSGLNRTEKMSVVKLESGVFERFHALADFENALVYLYTNPEESKALLSAITDFRVELIRRIATYYQPDIITNLDDYGMQNTPMMSYEMFREFILPCDQRIGAAMKEAGVVYQHHSCGTITPFVEDLLDAGAKLLNLNPFNNDFDAMQKAYADRYVITCGLNTNSVICRPDVTEAELRAEVRRAMDQLAPYKNYIFYPAAVTEENNRILIDEARNYGWNYWNKKT